MTGLVERVRAKVPSACVMNGKLQRDGCSVSLRDAPKKRLIIDFDASGSPLGPDQNRCDYLFIAEVPGQPGLVVPLELKKGKLNAKDVVGQLQAGTKAAEKLVANDAAVAFRPVVAYGGHLNKAEREMLRKTPVRFFGCSEYVRLIKCRAPLAEVAP